MNRPPAFAELFQAGFDKAGKHDWIVVDYARNAEDMGNAQDAVDVIKAHIKVLSGGEEVKSQAVLARLYLNLGGKDMAQRHLEAARSGYQRLGNQSAFRLRRNPVAWDFA